MWRFTQATATAQSRDWRYRAGKPRRGVVQGSRQPLQSQPRLCDALRACAGRVCAGRPAVRVQYSDAKTPQGRFGEETTLRF